MAAVVKWILLVPVAVLAIMLAIANRTQVSIVFDPFPPASSGLTFAAPLFLIILVSVIFGVLLGGFGAWLRQGRHRRAARQARAEADRQRVETDRLRSQINAFASLPSHAPGDQRIA
ncbi:MAG: lipopolysaccharide assembly protein LapA domain-containing protein [Beijerinckiaceae bacterium]|nr:lipopolysaccharide assembly protein LapA domain-containing protein [Beijerinckiaceae bacterium]